MSDDIYRLANGQDSFAHIGEAGWHGKGQQLQAGATIEEWAAAAGFNYNIVPTPVLYRAPDGNLREFPNRVAFHRSDDGNPIGIGSKRFQQVQPIEVLSFFRDAAQHFDLTLETAGVIRGGAVYWALARTGLATRIRGNDVILSYVMLSTGADGSQATDARQTDVSVVCANTHRAAMQADGSGAVRTKHSVKWNSLETIEALGLVNLEANWEKFAESMHRLAATPIEHGAAIEFYTKLLRPVAPSKPAIGQGLAQLEKLIGVPLAPELEASKVRAIRGLEALEQSYLHAPGATPGSLYGVWNGLTHWLDHVRGSDDGRMHSAWFGQGADLKDQALEELVAIAR